MPYTLKWVSYMCTKFRVHGDKHCTDFVLDGRRLSNYGLMIGEIGGNSASTTTGGISVKNISIPRKGSFDIYASTYEDSIIHASNTGI